MGIMQIIREYTNQIVEGNFDAAEGICEKCHEKPGEYKLHECRKRQVRFSVGAVVEVAMTFVLRWKCSLCGATFTQYPPFIAPHKRFALPEIVRLSRKYLENDKSSYADAKIGTCFLSTKLHRAFQLFPVRPRPSSAATCCGGGRARADGWPSSRKENGKDCRWIENGLWKFGERPENMENVLFRAAVRCRSRICESSSKGGSWLRTSHRSRCSRIFLTIGPASRIEIIRI